MINVNQLKSDMSYATAKCRLLLASVTTMVALSACTSVDDNPVTPTPKKNDAVLIKDKDKLAMIDRKSVV